MEISDYTDGTTVVGIVTAVITSYLHPLPQEQGGLFYEHAAVAAAVSVVLSTFLSPLVSVNECSSIIAGMLFGLAGSSSVGYVL